MTLFGFGPNIADITGNLISHTRQGSALRCAILYPDVPEQMARATIGCSTFHVDPANPIHPDEIIGGLRCQESFTADESNRIGDPLHCNAGVGDFALQLCSPDVDASCSPAGKPGADDRGVPYAGQCACSLVSLQASSWGKIKAYYR
jgi:hypothetical protein